MGSKALQKKRVCKTIDDAETLIDQDLLEVLVLRLDTLEQLLADLHLRVGILTELVKRIELRIVEY